MFDAVLGHEATQRKVGTGALMSVGFHAALLCGAVWISARAVVPHADERPPVICRLFGGHAGARAGTPAATPAHAAARHTAAKPHVIPNAPPVAPSTVAPEPAPKVGAAIDADGRPSDNASDGDGAGGRCTGAECAEAGDGTEKTGTGPGEGPGGGGGDITLPPYGPGMTPPVLLSSTPIQMSAQALAAHVAGSMIVDCALSEAGTVSDCHVIKSLPFMDDATIRGLMERRYKPVTFEGKPVSVRYKFGVKVVSP
jgi:protein TonB